MYHKATIVTCHGRLLRNENVFGSEYESFNTINRRSSDDFRENRSYLICLDSLNIRKEIWRRSLEIHALTRALRTLSNI